MSVGEFDILCPFSWEHLQIGVNQVGKSPGGNDRQVIINTWD